MPTSKLITKWFFPCEKRLDDKLERHKEEMHKLVETIREHKNAMGKK